MSELIMLRAAETAPWPGLNPRRRFDPAKVAELAGSIEENGVLQNVTVHDRGEDEEPRYWLVIGETRWRAVSELAARDVEVPLPANVRVFTEAQALRLALIENLQRQELTPIEEARGFQHYLELNPDLTQEQLGEEFEVDQSYVSNRIRLLQLPESMQLLVEDGRLAVSYARDLLLPWTAEAPEIANRFFSILQQQIRVNSDFNVPVTRVWLDQVIAKIAEVVKPEKPKPAAKPAPPPKKVTARGKAAAAKKTAATKPAAKKSSGKPARAAEPDHPTTGKVHEGGDVNPDPMPTSGPGAPVAQQTPLPATLGKILLDVLKGRGITTIEQLQEQRDALVGTSGLAAGSKSMAAIDALLKSQPEKTWEEVGAIAETRVAPPLDGPVSGFFSAVNDLFGRYQLTAVAIAKPDGQVFVSIGAKPEHATLEQVPPVVIEGPADQIDAMVRARVTTLVAQLTTTQAAA